jgi:hypothetical protein
LEFVGLASPGVPLPQYLDAVVDLALILDSEIDLLDYIDSTSSQQ